MTQEQTQKLLKRFPVLYQDYYSPMWETCMCWGFDCGMGWFKIIWQLSLAIEEELGYSWLQKKRYMLLRRVSRKWNDFIYWLSPVGTSDILARSFVRLFPSAARRGQDLATFPRFPSTSYWWANLGFKRFSWRPYTGLAVGQVKEKFGTLRFYCPISDAIGKYIELAERLSAVTCESCGNRGHIYGRGYIRCLCDACALEKGRIPPSTKEEDDNEDD